MNPDDPLYPLVDFAIKHRTPGKVFYPSEYLTHYKDALGLVQDEEVPGLYITLVKHIETFIYNSEENYIVNLYWAALVLAQKLHIKHRMTLFKFAININHITMRWSYIQYVLTLIGVSPDETKYPHPDRAAMRPLWPTIMTLASSSECKGVANLFLENLEFRKEYLELIPKSTEKLTVDTAYDKLTVSNDVLYERLAIELADDGSPAPPEVPIEANLLVIWQWLNEMRKELQEDIVSTLRMAALLRNRMPDIAILNSLTFLFPKRLYTSDKLIGAAVQDFLTHDNESKATETFIEQNCVFLPKEKWPSKYAKVMATIQP